MAKFAFTQQVIMESGQQPSWQAPPRKRVHARLARDVRRITIVASLLVLSAALLWLLFPPFFAPQTHLVLIGSQGNGSFNAPPLSFVAEDLNAFKAIPEAKVIDQSDRWRSAQSARTLATGLSNTSASSADHLIVYLNAHGIVDASKAYLLCDNFDLRRPDAGRIAVDKFLSQVRQSPAAVKLVLLNAGSIDRDTGMGIIGNDFPRLLRQAVLESNDPTLWVYCSHSPLQYSHVSPAARRSVFGMFVSEAFMGAADLDQDQAIRLSELVGFTTANVSKWVAQQSDHCADQTPRLYWGGGSSPCPDPQLLTLFQNKRPGLLTASVLIGAEAESRSGTTAPPSAGRMQGVLHRQRVSLASNRMPIANGSGDPNSASPGTAPVPESGTVKSPADPASSVAGSPESETESPTTGDTPDVPATAGHATAAAPNSDQIALVNQKLSLAWRGRDESTRSWSAIDPISCPLENQPHLWSELQAELLSFEQQIFGAAGFQIKSIDQTLGESLNPPQGGGTPAVSPLNEMFRIAAPSPDDDASSLVPEKVHSIAIAERLVGIPGQPFLKDIDSLRSTLDQPTRDAFDEWFKTHLNARYSQYVEWVTLHRLSVTPELEWPLVKAAATTCLNGERVAALDLLVNHFLREKISRADQLRYFAEQLMFDRVGLEWQQRTLEMLQQADTLYASAEADFDSIRSAQRLQETLFSRVPYYLHWYRADQIAATQNGDSIFADLSQLLDRLAELNSLLDHPESTNVDDLATLRDGLAVLQSRIETHCGDDAALRLLDRPEVPGDSYQAECLLATPLLTAATRGRLLQAVPSRDRQLAIHFDLASVSKADLNGWYDAGPTSTPSPGQWRHVIRQAELETKYISLCDSLLEIDSDPTMAQANRLQPPHGSMINASHQVRTAYQELDSALKSLETSSQQSKQSSENEPMLDSNLWQAHSTFCQSLQVFYRSAPELEDLILPCDDSIERIHAVTRMLRMVDPRDAWQLTHIDANSLTISSRLRSTLLWHANRFEQASLYQHDRISHPFMAWADAYRMLSDSMCRSRDPQSDSSQMILSGPHAVDLQYVDWTDIAIQLTNPSKDAADITVALDYEPELIDVSTESSRNVDPRFVDGMSQFGTRRIEPFSIAPGESATLAFRLSRRSNATESTKLIVDVFSKTSLTRADSHAPVLLTRQTIDVTLPVAELVVQQDEQAIVSGIDGLELTPYPNRTESFRIGVTNRSSRTKPVSIQCFALKQPIIDFSDARQTARVLAAAPLASFEVSAPGDGTVAFPGPPPQKPTTASIDGDEKKPDPAADAPAAEPIPSTDLPFGMLVTMTDGETGQSTLRKISHSVQRPRRFVRPRVGYDVSKQQIQIEVAAIDEDRLPQGAPVRVECRLADDFEGRTTGKMQGLLTKSNPVAKMFIAMTTPPPRNTRVVIDVDGYPRAFLYDVPCGKHVSDVPEIVDLVELKMTASSKNGVLGATKSIPVALRLDAPVGAFENGRDYLDVGLDLDESGLPAPEDRVRLTTDRGVRMGFIQATPDGKMKLINEVSDHLIDLPADRLENLRLDIAAALTLNGAMRVFPSIELLIDTAAPIVGPVVRPDGMDFVGVNQSVEWNVWAWDEGSDVTSVQAAFDVDGSAEFPAAGKFFSASRTASRQWTLTVDAGPDAGKKSLLVRATDRVGNSSEPISLDIEVVSAAENQNRIRQQTVDLLGSVKFRENNVAQAEIQLSAVAQEENGSAASSQPAASAPPPPLAARSAENGGYRIAGVPPGNYRMETRAVIRNRVHRTEQSVEVTVGPDRQLRIDVVLP